MNIFDSLKLYPTSWVVAEERKFNANELSRIDRAEVVTSEYGLSARFTLKTGGYNYIPLSQDAAYCCGENLSPENLTLIMLTRGEDTIFRIK